jgi:hypothetical protein
MIILVTVAPCWLWPSVWPSPVTAGRGCGPCRAACSTPGMGLADQRPRAFWQGRRRVLSASRRWAPSALARSWLASLRAQAQQHARRRGCHHDRLARPRVQGATWWRGPKSADDQVREPSIPPGPARAGQLNKHIVTCRSLQVIAADAAIPRIPLSTSTPDPVSEDFTTPPSHIPFACKAGALKSVAA